MAGNPDDAWFRNWTVNGEIVVHNPTKITIYFTEFPDVRYSIKTFNWTAVGWFKRPDGSKWALLTDRFLLQHPFKPLPYRVARRMRKRLLSEAREAWIKGQD